MNKDSNKNNTSWGSVSSWYDDLLEHDDDSYQVKVVLPNLTRIVNPRPGLQIFDLACGQGFFSRAYAALGAEVVASDISSELIKLAEEKKSQNIEYFVSPAHKAGSVKDESIDVVTIVLALQNIENMTEVFSEVYRVLKPGGKFVIVLNHPAFRIPEKTFWRFDEEKNMQYRATYSYLSESRHSIVMHPGKEKSPETISFHRPLQLYFKSLVKNGFCVTRLEEWISHKVSQSGPRKDAEDKARKEIPLFLCIEAEKKLQ